MFKNPCDEIFYRTLNVTLTVISCKVTRHRPASLSVAEHDIPGPQPESHEMVSVCVHLIVHV